jgi:putative tricarboxylic transport membrane protein
MNAAPEATEAQGKRAGRSEYGVVGLLAGLGVLVLWQTQSITESMASARTLGPRVAPYFVAGLLLITAVLLLVDLLRGGHGYQEEGEDVDLSHGTDWKILLALAALIVGAGQLIPFLGIPIAGPLLFFGVVRLLGGHKLWLDALVSVVVPVVAYLLFTEGLGLYIPGGFF